MKIQMKMAPVIVALAALQGSVWATEMVYTPLIPAFGGSPNYGTPFAAAAAGQNSYRAPTLSPLQQFNKSLEQAILNRLTNNSVTTLFGAANTNLVVGTYDTLGYTVKVEDFGQNQLKVTTTDKNTGDSVEFIIAKNAIDTAGP